MGLEVSASAGSGAGVAVRAQAAVDLNLALSPKTDADIERLARDIGGTKADVFTWALALLTVAVDARKKGKRLAVVDEDGRIDTEITGL
jgi:hypothetical protein